MDSDDASAAQQQISQSSGDILSISHLSIEQAAAAVPLPSNLASNLAPEESPAHQTAGGDLVESGSVFSFMSVDASSMPDVAASTCGEALASQTATEASVDGEGSAFSFL